MKIKEYTTIYAIEGGLDEGVNNLIKQGWQPLGGMCVFETGMSQAMVKYEEVRSSVETEPNYSELFKNVSDESYLWACRNLGIMPKAEHMNKNKQKEPFFEWQENRPDNKPKINNKVILKYKLEKEYGYYVASFNGNDWNTSIFNIYNDKVHEWAYMPG